MRQKIIAVKLTFHVPYANVFGAAGEAEKRVIAAKEALAACEGVKVVDVGISYTSVENGKS